MRENVEVAALGVGAVAREARDGGPPSSSSCSASRAQAELPAGALAHGDERRLGVARALATEPRFVLMDEPAAGLPEAEVPEFAAVVRSVRDDHDAGVLLIDHNMALIMDVCDRIQVLDQGRTLAEGTPDEIRGNLDVAAAYLGESAVATRSRRERRSSLELDSRGALRRASPPCAASRSRSSRGEIVGLIGPNGAGKSSTLHAIMGLVPVAAGDVRLGGRSAPRTAPEDVARSGHRARARGPPHLRASSPSRRTSGSGSPARRSQDGAERGRRAVLRPLPDRRASSARRHAGRALGRPAAAARDRARARRRGRTCSCSTSPRSGSRRQIVDVVFEALAADPRARHRGPARRAARAADGRARRPHARARERRAPAHPDPDDAGDTERMVAAYLS